MIHEEVAFTWAQNIKPKYKKLANSEAESFFKKQSYRKHIPPLEPTPKYESKYISTFTVQQMLD